ncbi:MAG: linear amide C-N hydrolase [Muribaculaceae bacterium]|nr:linear amide C-N hydrolase [Muribaculaceae bacterium]
MNKKKTLAIAALFGLASFTGVGIQQIDACSRVVYVGDDSLKIVGRSLDWKTPIPTNLYVYPRGFKHVSSDQPGALTWTSKYGAVYAVGYDGGITEGMNEKGLVINGLFCKGTVYNNPETNGRPPMSLAVFVAWMLDRFETTDQVVALLKEGNFSIGGATFDGGTVSALHWGITDAQGNTAYVEFNNGNINIYQGKDLRVLTNDPQWPQMEAIINYWHGVGGQNMLPGTVKSPDRAVRADYFVHHVKSTGDADLGLSIIRSILFNVSVPYTYTIETEPNVSSTQWRSFANLRDKRYYFDIVTNMGIYYIDLNNVNLKPGAPVMKLNTSVITDILGDVTMCLTPSKPFTPMY